MTIITPGKGSNSIKVRRSRKSANEVPTENEDQIKLSCWLNSKNIRHNANANGAKRTIQAGRKLKAMGMSPGFPDIEIPIPRGKYSGLYIELKRVKGGRLSTEQRDWLVFLRSNNYYAEVAYGFHEAVEIVCTYFGLTKPAA